MPSHVAFFECNKANNSRWRRLFVFENEKINIFSVFENEEINFFENYRKETLTCSVVNTYKYYCDAQIHIVYTDYLQWVVKDEN